MLPYPTLSEIGKRAAIDFFTPQFDEPMCAAHHRLAANLRLRRHCIRTTNQRPNPHAACARRARRVRIGLSGKLLVLTILFVMVAEVLIYVPSIANFRLNWLNDRLAAAHTAALVLDAAPSGMVPESLAKQILNSIGARAVAMKMGNAAPPAGGLQCCPRTSSRTSTCAA